MRLSPTILALAAVAAGCSQSRASNGTAEPRKVAKASAEFAPVATAPVAAAPVPSAKRPEPPLGRRVYAKTRHVWIQPEPSAEGQWIGFLWTGESVRLKSETPRPGPGCERFYEIEPQGFVCVDEKRATLDPDDPVVRAIEPYAARADTPWPHRYGESTGATRLLRLPEGASLSFPALPRNIAEDRAELRARSTVAYSAEATVGDKAFLLTADFAWVPKDRVTPYPEVTFQGVELGPGARLPLALFRGKDRQQFERAADGSFRATSEPFKRLSSVELSGERAEFGGESYLQVRSGDRWVKETEAVVPAPQALSPWGATVGAEDTTGKAPKGRATWIEVSIRGGWLIAFEGTKPVFVTLISAGRGGEPVAGKDLISTASTPVGSYPITGKFVTATMEAPNEYIHSDVPWTQNFHGPHALHGAYWHDDWGNLKSGGCINVSPIDGKRLFEWTEPKVPEGWHGLRWLPWQGPATVIVVHK
ncbi:MAG TPA: L,D-transpeptidase [Polyangiaceae bacterium]|nr:L,D-transpeptidase [Polyangiaceae bacterium]